MRLYLKLATFVVALAGIQWGIDHGFCGLTAGWCFDIRAAWAMSYGTDADREAVVSAYSDALARSRGVDNDGAWAANAAAGWGPRECHASAVAGGD